MALITISLSHRQFRGEIGTFLQTLFLILRIKRFFLKIFKLTKKIFEKLFNSVLLTFESSKSSCRVPFIGFLRFYIKHNHLRVGRPFLCDFENKITLFFSIALFSYDLILMLSRKPRRGILIRARRGN